MPKTTEALDKNLTLFDVYAISTGAMFSSGFFLLPGIASAETGPSIILAYLVAGLLILPPMFSIAELTTAMPKAGGAYYFLDRSLGPLAGTVGGLGTWLALAFKSAFALIGMGAYLALFVELPIKPLAAALTVAFAVLNIVGAKETSGLQRILVTVLVSVLVFYVVQGLMTVAGMEPAAIGKQLTPFLPFGPTGFASTIGLVFVSYAGLTKVASVAEEVQNPDRNIPLGMGLSLLTATFIYVVGTFIMVAVLDPQALREDLTPVATSGEVFLNWLPEPAGLILIVVAAIAAFASTGNAGILSASRYPLAMARDRLVSPRFATLGRFGTPTLAILVTSALMLAIIFGFSEEGVAKLASAFQLLLFALVNFAVIIMRESQLPSYAPGYRSPLYPWMQIAGIVFSLLLIAEMGNLSILFTAFLVIVGIGWYFYYARLHVTREGAIYHLFARLGRYRHDDLDTELQGILEEKGSTEVDSFDRLVARADVLFRPAPHTYADAVAAAAERLSERIDATPEAISRYFLEGSPYSSVSVSHQAVLPYALLPNLEREELVMIHCAGGVEVSLDDAQAPGEGISGTAGRTATAYALFFLVSPREDQSLHLRTQAALVHRIEDASFMTEWREATNEQQAKETLLHHERYLSLHLVAESAAADFIDQRVADLNIPASTLVALVRRNGAIMVPRGDTVLHAGDRITIIGDPAGIERLYELYRQRHGVTRR
ncbi:amino acid permease [Salisaeta longa]|uniref:amino acid permease n=1 Tax=Salisaeta longa TaxID=503170 RepID=UPI0003B33FA9|nr:amino acid permease [Salisaeta longa]